MKISRRKNNKPAKNATMAATKNRASLNARRGVARVCRQLCLERSATIDDAGETTGQHRQHGADTREEKHRRHGELDRMGDRRNAGGLLQGQAQVHRGVSCVRRLKN